MYIIIPTCMVKFSGANPKVLLYIFQNIDGFRQTIHKAFRIHKTL